MSVRPLVLLAAAAVVLGTAWWWTSLRGESEPARVTLADLAFDQEDHDGRRVRTEGALRRFGPEDGATRLHYVVEDEAANRVEVVGGDPAPWVGRLVEVVGRFRFNETSGRVIEVERIEAR